MILYLDDWRRPPEGENIVSADNYPDFIALIDKYKDCIEMLDLDYDLGYDSLYSGYNVLLYIKKYKITCKHINIHSTHPSGREIMIKYARTNFPETEITSWC